MAFISRVTNVPDMTTFISAIINFAISNGSFSDEGSGSGGLRVLKRGSVYWCFMPGGARVNGYITVYPMLCRMTYQKPTGASDFSTVPGQPAYTILSPWKGGGPYISFYLYQTDHAIHGVLEVLPKVYIHFSFGVINTVPGIVGGEYISSQAMFYNNNGTFSAYSTRNIHPFDGGYGEYFTPWNSDPRSNPGFLRHIQRGVLENNSNDFAPIGSGINNGKRVIMVTMSGIVNSLLGNFGTNSFNLRSAIFPIYVRSLDVATANIYFHIGQVPGVGYLNGRLMPEASMVDLNWQVFPLASRENPTDLTTYQSPTGKSLAYLRA